MTLLLSQQTTAFLGSLMLGVVLGAMFDVFRVFRKAFCQPVWLIWSEDVFYLLICAVITFSYMLQSNEGQVRIFIVFGEFIGATVYYLTLGKLVMAVSLIIISVITKMLGFLYIVIIRPIILLFKFVIGILHKIFGSFINIVKNTLTKFKIVLKHWCKILYNCFKNIGKKFSLKKERRSAWLKMVARLRKKTAS